MRAFLTLCAVLLYALALVAGPGAVAAPAPFGMPAPMAHAHDMAVHHHQGHRDHHQGPGLTCQGHCLAAQAAIADSPLQPIAPAAARRIFPAQPQSAWTGTRPAPEPYPPRPQPAV